MRRFHTHIAVDDLASNLIFYTKSISQPPTKQEVDYELILDRYSLALL